jgi:hypothetical protein
MASLSSALDDGCTFGVDGASEIKVKEVEGHFNFHDFLFADVLSHPRLGIEWFFWHILNRLLLTDIR